MKYKITDNTLSIDQATSVQSNIFLRKFSEQVVKEAFQNTPKKTGRLRNDVLKQVLGLNGKIAWRKNYAVFQEKKQFKNYTTPGTGPNFAKNAVTKVFDKSASIARSAGLI